MLADAGSAQYLLAEALLEPVSRALGDGSTWTVLKRFKGRELEGCLHPPLVDRESPLILGEHVTWNRAPAGAYCTGARAGRLRGGARLQAAGAGPLDDSGVFTAEAGEFAGMHYSSGGKAVIEALRRSGALLKASTIEHQYPNCWRCKEPVLFRATEQWFASVEGFRKEALAAVQEVHWTPPWGEERIYNMIAERQDWCISRQRIWGCRSPSSTARAAMSR